jgi:heptosyltransferase III
VHFFIKTLSSPKKILIIIQRSNGDVFLSLNLINELLNFYKNSQIDLFVNDDTLAVAELIPQVSNIFTFSYRKKNNARWSQEFAIFSSIYRKYDLSISLTASDRSVLYALFASQNSISVIENNNRKSWWKKIFLNKYYHFNQDRHVFINNMTPLDLLNINYSYTLQPIEASDAVLKKMKNILSKIKVKDFIIFHPSAQYSYKIYPKHLREELLKYLNNLGVAVLVTGAKNKIDIEIKLNLPSLPNIYDFIGETSLEEYIALSHLAKAYVGMDTLNMHIASSQNKRIFAIFGPTKLSNWSPWSNELNTAASNNFPVQTYGNISIFQAKKPCVACGLAGCNDDHGKSECLDLIDPKIVYEEIEKFLI